MTSPDALHTAPLGSRPPESILLFSSGPSTIFAPLTFRDNAFHADHTAEEAGREGAGRDVLGAEAAFQAYVELLILLGVGGVNGGHEILQSPLEGDQLLKSIVQEAAWGGDQEPLDRARETDPRNRKEQPRVSERKPMSTLPCHRVRLGKIHQN